MQACFKTIISWGGGEVKAYWRSSAMTGPHCMLESFILLQILKSRQKWDEILEAI